MSEKIIKKINIYFPIRQFLRYQIWKLNRHFGRGKLGLSECLYCISQRQYGLEYQLIASLAFSKALMAFSLLLFIKNRKSVVKAAKKKKI